jgi:catechol 2,3-dioxygenase-like lactoylglutathione lyase family enzyme
MERIISKLLEEFERGKMSRRELIRSLALGATASLGVASAAAPVAAAGGFKTVAVDHISYQVADYRKTRDFYADLMGMAVSDDDGHECRLHAGDAVVIARNHPRPATRPVVDHLAFRIDDWNTARVEAELKRRGLKPRLDTAGPVKNWGSFHVQDPDGFDLQISGVVKPGDSLYKKP